MKARLAIAAAALLFPLSSQAQIPVGGQGQTSAQCPELHLPDGTLLLIPRQPGANIAFEDYPRLTAPEARHAWSGPESAWPERSHAWPPAEGTWPERRQEWSGFRGTLPGQGAWGERPHVFLDRQSVLPEQYNIAPDGFPASSNHIVAQVKQGLIEIGQHMVRFGCGLVGLCIHNDQSFSDGAKNTMGQKCQCPNWQRLQPCVWVNETSRTVAPGELGEQEGM